ncbi:IS5 family transposase [Bacteroidota bacterium]
MYEYTSINQVKIEEFKTDFEVALDPKNRWIQLSSITPWDDLIREYIKSLNPKYGTPGLNPRVAVGSLIVKHKLNLSDEETIRTIQENMFIQYFLGLDKYHPKPLFHPSVFVDLRKRMGVDNYDRVTQKIIQSARDQELKEKGKGQKRVKKNWGVLQLDATVADQYIKYPNDLELLNDSREWSEDLIDIIYEASLLEKKPRTYRRVARQDFLKVAKKKNKSSQEIRRAIRKQLNYLRRNFGYIDDMLDMFEQGAFPLNHTEQRYLWVIREVYRQQNYMYKNNTHQCEHRIVSIHQPHVRPIVRGKVKSKVEFGSKIGVSLNCGYARINKLSWDAYNECNDVEAQVEAYKEIHGHYPEVLLVDKIYLTRKNREWLNSKGIQITNKPLGRPKKETSYEKSKKKKLKNKRNQIEGKFGEGKNGNSLNKVRARLKDTSESWVAGIFFVMNLNMLYSQLML